MNEAEAKELLQAERARVEGLIEETNRSGRDDRSAAGEPGNTGDSVDPLPSELTDDAATADVRDRLEAIGWSERRLAEGTSAARGAAVRPIAGDRLRADPTAELTVGEARRV